MSQTQLQRLQLQRLQDLQNRAPANLAKLAARAFEIIVIMLAIRQRAAYT